MKSIGKQTLWHKIISVTMLQQIRWIYIYIYTYIYIYIYTYKYIFYIYIYLHTYAGIYMNICIYNIGMYV